jgi:hypothetical protein
MPRGDKPFQILEKINDNTYKMELPCEYDINAIFNVYDLSLFNVGDDSMVNPFEERKNDAILVSNLSRQGISFRLKLDFNYVIKLQN